MHFIPLARIPAQTFTTTLAGQDCTLTLYWRQERLYLDLVSDPITICRGAVCQNRADIVQSPSRFFKGTLHFLDLEGDSPPHFDNLHDGTSGRWVLLYREEGEESPALPQD